MNLESRVKCASSSDDFATRDPLQVAETISMKLAESLEMPLLELIQAAELIDNDIDLLVSGGDTDRAYVATLKVCDVALAIAIIEPQTLEEAKSKLAYISQHRKSYGPTKCGVTAMLDAIIDFDSAWWSIWIVDRDDWGPHSVH